MRFQISVLLLQFVTFCSQYNFGIAKALVGQNVRRVTESEFQYVVSISRIDDESDDIPENNHECSGTLVSRKDVITAAHCFNRLLLEDIVVIVGTLDLREGRNYYPSWWLSYEEWAAEFNIPVQHPFNDIAMMRLAESVPGNIRPVSLTLRRNSEIFGLNVQTAGWGMAPSGDMDRFMKTVQVNVLSHRECERRITLEVEAIVYVRQNLLCSTAQPYAILRKGDSGGPLVYRGVLIGINKGTCLFPELGFHPDQINMHLSIDYYRTFIRDIINNF